VRRRLLVATAASTALVLLAFLVPLLVLVRQSAADRAVAEATRAVQALVPVVALGDDASVDAAAAAAGAQTPSVVTVVLPTGDVVGELGELLALRGVGGRRSAGHAGAHNNSGNDSNLGDHAHGERGPDGVGNASIDPTGAHGDADPNGHGDSGARRYTRSCFQGQSDPAVSASLRTNPGSNQPGGGGRDLCRQVRGYPGRYRRAVRHTLAGYCGRQRHRRSNRTSDRTAVEHSDRRRTAQTDRSASTESHSDAFRCPAYAVAYGERTHLGEPRRWLAGRWRKGRDRAALAARARYAPRRAV